ncbi:DUF262 domain-containing protein [Bacillus sp. N3536]|nr:DUF262 domain-containing protein [Bacillus sp. N3536]
MQQPEPLSTNFNMFIDDIDRGVIKIPQFQREFVWSIEQSAKLIDSILKGYPIGTFILWESDEQLRSIRNIGGAPLPETPPGTKVQYVLDGQQRMTSLYASLKGLQIQKGNRIEDFSNIYIDLIADEDDILVLTDVSEHDKDTVISLKTLMEGTLSTIFQYPSQLHDKIQSYKDRLKTYRFSTILMRDASLDIATEVFTRLNVGGKSLSVFEIMVAKTYDESKSFDLSEQYQKFIDEVESVGYETISDSTLLQTVSVFLKGECTGKSILKLEKQAFIEVWPKAIDSLFKAIELFRHTFRIPVSKLLPYNGLLVPFAYFFFKHPTKPVGEQLKYLEDFYWRTVVTERYSTGLETKIAQDIRKIDVILQNELPKYETQVDVSKEMIINNGWFSVNRSFIKGMLCLMAFNEPKSFNDNSIVQISNDWLKQGNSRNYHHFFPKAFLKKNGEEEYYINHIVNITIVDDFLNKNIIRAKAPSEYMSSFKSINQVLDTTMKTHLIDDLDEYGVWNDNYDLFFDKRAERLSEELSKRIILQKTTIK